MGMRKRYYKKAKGCLRYEVLPLALVNGTKTQMGYRRGHEVVFSEDQWTSKIGCKSEKNRFLANSPDIATR